MNILFILTDISSNKYLNTENLCELLFSIAVFIGWIGLNIKAHLCEQLAQFSDLQEVLGKSLFKEITHLSFPSAKAILCVRSFLVELHIYNQITEMSLLVKCENTIRSLF